MVDIMEDGGALTTAQVRALKWLEEHGGVGVINRYGRIIAAGEKSGIAPETWLRLMTMQCIVPDGRYRIQMAGRFIEE